MLSQTRPLETAESGTWLSIVKQYWHEISNTGILTLVRRDETAIDSATWKKKGLTMPICKFSRGQRVEGKIYGREVDVKQLAKGMDNTTMSCRTILQVVHHNRARFQKCECDQPVVDQQLPYRPVVGPVSYRQERCAPRQTVWQLKIAALIERCRIVSRRQTEAKIACSWRSTRVRRLVVQKPTSAIWETAKAGVRAGVREPR